MTKAKSLLASAICLPLLAISGQSFAATAHNSETNAHTKNAADTAADANMKQMHMRKHIRHRAM